MADRNSRTRNTRREGYRGPPDHDRQPRYGQQEQFSSAGEWEYDDDRPYQQMGENPYGRDQYGQLDPAYASERDRNERYARDERGYGGRGRDYPASGRYNYGPARIEGPDRGFASFTGEDQAGRDFTAPTRRRGYGGQGAGDPAGYGYPGGTTRGDFYRDEHERGFFDRAGDEVASWFGDEDAARRREMDHSGRGPQNYTRSDERILEDACDHLTEDWAIDARNVQVTVDKGEITLDGTVATRDEKRRAEDCVEDISGVGHVQNNLRVQERSEWQSDRRNEDVTAEQPAAKT